MSNSKKKVTIIELFKIAIKRVRLSTLILLLITFASTSFAWFIYATKISAGITAHIEGWNILFTANDNAISETVNFVIPNLYPGMTDYEDSITAYNLGERNATISYEILSASVLGVNYTIDGTTLTSDMMTNILANNFPFSIELSLSSSSVTPTSGSTTFSIEASWPYESGNDALDTTWGNNAYTFKQNNPNTPCVSITVRISAIQDNSEDNPVTPQEP